MKNLFVIALVFALGFTILASSADNAYAQAIRNNAGFTSNTLLPNDDGSTGAVAIGFMVDFFNVMTGNLFVNNNGNITFDSPLFTFTPFDLTSTGQQIIAPFFADVDTRNAGSPVTYGQDTVNGRPAFGVNWIDVDCFASGGAQQPFGFNDFQLVIIERFDTGAGNFDFEFNYDSIMWETGQASGGDPMCLGGTSARVGYSDGSGDPGTFFELAGSAVNGAFLDSNLVTGLIHNSIPGNTQPLGRYLFEVREGQVSIPTPAVSGEILDVNSTALLLAGLQANLVWMIPIGISTVVAGAYLARNRWQ